MKIEQQSEIRDLKSAAGWPRPRADGEKQKIGHAREAKQTETEDLVRNLRLKKQRWELCKTCLWCNPQILSISGDVNIRSRLGFHFGHLGLFLCRFRLWTEYGALLTVEHGRHAEFV